MFNGHRRVPPAVNDPIRSYAPGSPERASIKARLSCMAAETVDIPLVIGGQAVSTGSTAKAVMPHDHQHVLGNYHKASDAQVQQAIAAAQAAHKEWSGWSFDDRAAVILKAAELLRTTWRDTINAATMLGQSKTVFQAEIDAAAEIVDFWRFNVHYGQELLEEQPVSDHTMWNQLEYRALEGFVYAVTPFNFTSIAANLPTAPALMGNTVVWKPAHTQILSAWYWLRLLQEAGLPPGVINLVTGHAPTIGQVVLDHPELAGVHFTGSTGVFQWMWKTIGENIARYRTYPRLVGETGGKDFLVAHPSAEPDALVTAVVRGGYEYQGQKCSALSRLYVADSVYKKIESSLVDTVRSLKMGDVADFTNFMGAVIDKASFTKLKQACEGARTDPRLKLLAGGECDDKVGWFVRPTLVRTDDPKHRYMEEEFFGPLLTMYVYPDNQYEDVLHLVDSTSPYALTGAVFANDRAAIHRAHQVLRHAAGNFYVNDKPTGAVVGQQPFGGARASGTNDKAGSALNLLRWVSARTIKETFVPPTHYAYPFMKET